MLMKIVFVCLVAVILHHAWKVISFLRPSGYLHNHAPGPCRIVPGVDRGSEDLHLLQNGLVLISSGLENFALFRISEESKPGRLLLFDFNKPDEVEELKLPDRFKDKPLVPHGISVFQPSNSDIATVFVVNHGDTDHEKIEKFHLDLRTHKLTHLESIQDELFLRINDIVAISEDSFYATQDIGARSNLGRYTEMLLMLRLGSVFFYDGKSARTVVDGLAIPNGIDTTPDGRYVYVSNVGIRSVQVYERDHKTNNLAIKQVYPVNTGCDNVILDSAGDIWIGAHPDGMALANHLFNGSLPAPSQVLRLKTNANTGLITSLTEVYADNGQTISASSSVVHHNSQILIGTVLRLKTSSGLITSMTEVYADDGQTISASSSVVHHNDQILIGTVRHKMLLCDLKTG